MDEITLQSLAAGQQALTHILNTLMQQMQANAAQVQAAPAATVAANKTTIARPEPYKTRSEDARRFINYFTLWARSQGQPLNTAPNGTMNPEQWISSFLSLLQGEAAVWAVPYLQKIEAHTSDTANPRTHLFPAGGNWDTFLTEFKQRFQAVDDAAVARQALARLTQGTSSVGHYASRFQEIAACTGLSDTDLMYRFKNGLNQITRYTYGFASLHEPPENLADLIKLAIKADFTLRQETGSNGRMPFAAPAADPMAMDIDATRTQSRPGPNGKTREEYLSHMRGKCFGCGDSSHTKANGNHSSIHCDYCSRAGHYSRVCQDRYMGLEKGRGLRTCPAQGQRVAATSQPFSLFDEPGPSNAPVSDATLASYQATLAEQTRLLTAIQQGFPSRST